MKIAAALAAAALLAVPAAEAKFRMTMRIGDSTPKVGQPFTVAVTTGEPVPANDFIRLVAIAPGASWYDVLSAVTAGNRARGGFAVRFVRVAPTRWRGIVRLPRPGRWRIVVPNGTKDGFMLPPPLMRSVVVSA